MTRKIRFGRIATDSCSRPVTRKTPNLPVQIYIVDDEPSICTAYARLVRSAKMQPRTFDSVEEFMGGDLSASSSTVSKLR